MTNSEPQNPVSGTAATFSYAYDSSNRRIWKGWMTTSQNEVYYLYGADGRQIASYALTITTSGGRQHLALNLVQQHVYFAGVDIYNNPQDRLGSQPMANFYAYGEEKSVTANEAFKFATYWRDGESGLDYAVNRYYASSMGTFLSPDPADSSMDPKNPQSFNRYAYAMGDPVNSKDPTGLDDAGGPACLDPAYADSHAECQQPGSPYCLGDPSDPSCGGYGPVRVLGGSSGGGSAAPTQRCPTRSCWVGHCCPRGIWR